MVRRNARNAKRNGRHSLSSSTATCNIHEIKRQGCGSRRLITLTYIKYEVHRN
nr:MAG TPA: hypothetical protein [Caudoviricetes sp.]